MKSPFVAFVESRHVKNVANGMSFTLDPRYQPATTNTDAAAASDALSTAMFHLFPKLPPEIRVRIWKLALPDGHVLELDFCRKIDEWYCPAESHLQSACSLLSTSRESRAEFLGVYHPLFTQKLSGGGWRGGRACKHSTSHGPLVYIDPKVDTMLVSGSSDGDLTIFECNNITQLASFTQRLQITRLAFQPQDLLNYFHWVESNSKGKRALRSFLSSFRRLAFVIGDMEAIDFGADWGFNARPRGSINLLKELSEETQSHDYEGRLREYMEDLFAKAKVENETFQAPELEFREIQRADVLMDNHNYLFWEYDW